MTDPVRRLWRGSRRAVARDFLIAFAELRKSVKLVNGQVEVDWGAGRVVVRLPIGTLICLP